MLTNRTAKTKQNKTKQRTYLELQSVEVDGSVEALKAIGDVRGHGDHHQLISGCC